MNRNDAKKIAEIITPEQFHQMLANAKNNIKDWTKVSVCNKGLTKGVAWNILSKVDPNDRCKLGIINAIHEFGDWLPKELLIEKESKPQFKPTHQEPDFNDFTL